MAIELSSLGAAQAYGQVGGISSSVGGAAAESLKPSQMAANAAAEFADTFNRADAAVQSMARGEGDAMAVVQAMAEAELALQTVVSIRDRVVEAYQEILRMPV